MPSSPATYPDSVQFLYSLGNEHKTIKFGLERIERVLRALGDPQESFRIVHVAGTNGKGSTCAMVEGGLRAAGFSTGLFTSPHLVEPAERIRIDGVPTSPEEFAGAFNRVHAAAEELLAAGEIDFHTTYFETVTAMAFLVFRERRCEWAVLEVGMGGRLDATNVVRPRVCAVTRVDLDHQKFLGGTIEEIAREKAGILKPGVPAVFGGQRPEAAVVLEARATEVGAPFSWATGYETLALNAGGSRLRMAGLRIESPLPGEHQMENAATAAMVLRSAGVADEAIQRGIAETRWPGRLERVTTSPDIYLDGAHNPAGAAALANYIRRFHTGRKIWIVFGAMRDKEVEGIARILFPLANRVLLTAPHQKRSLEPEAMRAYAPSTAVVCGTVMEAVELVRREAGAEDVVFITGSLYLVGEARPLLVQ